jgi:hypothetical protein
MDAAAIDVAEKENREKDIDQQDIFYCMVLFGPPGANAGKFTVATLTENYTFWPSYLLLRQTWEIKRL